MTGAIILAAGPNPDNSNWEEILVPKCLLSIGESSILEEIVKILRNQGINKVITIVGAKGQGWSEEAQDKISKISPIAINRDNDITNSAKSFEIGWKQGDFSREEKILVLDGDLIFQSSTITRFLTQSPNKILVSRGTSFGRRDGVVEAKADSVIRCGRGIVPRSFPWYVYQGIALLNPSCSFKISQISERNPNIEFLSAISKVALVEDISIFPLETTYSIRKDLEDIHRDLIGGSYATLKLQLLVRKECHGQGARKIKNEVEWLSQLPKNVRPFFPSVIHKKIKPNHAWYEMPYYEVPSLRKLLLENKIEVENALECLQNVLNFMWKNFYSIPLNKENQRLKGWIERLHLIRTEKRVAETWHRCETFHEIIEAEEVILNGHKYYNIPQILSSIWYNTELIKRLEPKWICLVHGDLHFQNILFQPDKPRKFILTDPRGDLNGSDMFYDLGKLWHSFHGYYDFLHTNSFELEYETNNKTIIAELRYIGEQSLSKYKELEVKIPKLLVSLPWIKKIQNWEQRTLFAEASNFSSVMPFHLTTTGPQDKAIAMYLTGTKLLNEFCEYSGIQIDTSLERIINVKEPTIPFDEIHWK